MQKDLCVSDRSIGPEIGVLFAADRWEPLTGHLGLRLHLTEILRGMHDRRVSLDFSIAGS